MDFNKRELILSFLQSVTLDDFVYRTSGANTYKCIASSSVEMNMDVSHSSVTFLSKKYNLNFKLVFSNEEDLDILHEVANILSKGIIDDLSENILDYHWINQGTDVYFNQKHKVMIKPEGMFINRKKIPLHSEKFNVLYTQVSTHIQESSIEDFKNDIEQFVNIRNQTLFQRLKSIFIG